MSPSPKSPTSLTGDSGGPSTGPLSPSLGSLQLDLYQKQDICIFLDASKQPSGYRSPGNNKTAPADVDADVVTYNAHHNIPLGRLHFAIKYDLDKSDLHVNVIEGKAEGKHGMILFFKHVYKWSESASSFYSRFATLNSCNL